MPADGQVMTDSVTQRDGDVELFLTFADQRVLIRFAGIDLAARQLPEAGERWRLAALRDEETVALEDRRPDDDLRSHGGHDRAVPDKPTLLTADQLGTQLEKLDGWSGDTSSIERTVECPSFPEAIELVRRVGDAAEAMNHHPDIDIRWRNVRFALSTHSAGGVTNYDTDLARQINELARGS